MNRYWGRNDSTDHRFTRDDDQLLALNYENLCDADYLNRLFFSESSDEGQSDQNAAYSSSNSSQPFEPMNAFISHGDMCEDIIMFGDKAEFGRNSLKKRNVRELSITSLGINDTFSSIIHKQVQLFEHLGEIICDRRGMIIEKPPILSQLSKLSDSGEKNIDVKLRISHHALMSSFKVLNSRGPGHINLDSIETMVLLFCKMADSDMSVKMNTGNISIYVRHIRDIFTKEINHAMKLVESVDCLTENLLVQQMKVASSCAYSILLTGLLSRSPLDLLIALINMIAINVRCKELEDDLLQSLQVPSSADAMSDHASIAYSSRAKIIDSVVIPAGNNNQSPINKGRTLIQPTSQIMSSFKSSHEGDDIATINKPAIIEANKSTLVSKAKDKPVVINPNSKFDKESVKTVKIKGKDDKSKSGPDSLLDLLEPNDIVHSGQSVTVLSMFHPSPPTSPRRSSVVRVKPSSSAQTLVSSSVSKLEYPKTSTSISIETSTANPSPDVLIAILRSIQLVPSNVLSLIHDSGAFNLHANAAINPIDLPSPMSDEGDGQSTPKTFVWSCGQNTYGELGHGDVNFRKSFSKIASMDSKQIVSVGAGNEHTVFLTKHGKLYVCGYNDNGQCGVGSTQQVKTPTLVQGVLDSEDIAQVHAYNGCEHTLAITRDGKLYAFGYNYRGQLGLGGTNSECIPRSVKCLLAQKVVLASCSYHHSIFLCSDGSMFSCGRNDFGQLGHGDTTDRRTPQLIPASISEVTQMSCGQFHTAVVTKQNIVYVCGKNDYGQLGFEGLDSLKVFTKLPTPQVDSDVITQVCCGYYHTLLLSNNGLVFGFGRNDYGQLGLGHVQPRVHTCTLISHLRDKNVLCVSAGCYHSIAVTSNSMLYVFGRNNHGQLGTGDVEERHTPHPVDEFLGKRILSVAAGFYHTVVLVTTAQDSSMPGPEEPEFVTSAPSSPISKRPMKFGFRSPALSDNKMAVVDDLSIASLSFDHDSSIMLGDETNPIAQYFKELGSLGTRSTDKLLLPRHLFSQTISSSTKDFLAYLSENLYTVISQCPSVISDMSSGGSKSNPKQLPTLTEANIIIRALKVFSLLMEICRHLIVDGMEVEIPLSSRQAVHLLRAVMLSVKQFFSQHGEKLKLAMTEHYGDKVEDLRSVDANIIAVSELLGRPKVNISTSSDIFTELSELKHSSAEDMSTMYKSISENVRRLRQELFSLYFYLPYDQVNQHFNVNVQTPTDGQCNASMSSASAFSPPANIHQTDSLNVVSGSGFLHHIVETASSVIARNIDVLFPTLTQSCQLYKVLATQLISIANANKTLSEDAMHDSMGSFDLEFECLVDYSRCLRLFSTICFRYRGIGDIIEFFKQSTPHGLLVFQQLLSVYSSLSMTFLENKSWPLMNATANEVHRALGTLDHCSANFSKVAIPIILQSEFSGSVGFEDYGLGRQICKEILSSAEQVIDFLSNLRIYDDFTTILRNATVLPTILPTLLLYCVASCNQAIARRSENSIGSSNTRGTDVKTVSLLGIVNEIQSLSKALQAIAKSVSDNDLIASQIPTKNNGSFKSTPEQSLNSTMNDIQAALSAPMTSASPFGILATGQAPKKDLNVTSQLTWYTKLQKLANILTAKIAAAAIQRPRSIMTVREVFNNSLNLTEVLEHKIWTYIFAPNLQGTTDGRKPSVTALLPVDYKPVCKISGSINKSLRANEMSRDSTYKVIIASARSVGKSSLIEQVEDILFDLALCNSFGPTDVFHQGKTLSSSRYFVEIWHRIANHTKHVQTQRSQLMSSLSADSATKWQDIIDQLRFFIIKSANYITNVCASRFSYSNHLPDLKFLKSSRIRQIWRRSIFVVVGVVRWQAAIRRSVRMQSLVVLDFTTKLLECATSNYSVADSSLWSNVWREFTAAVKLESEVAGKHFISGMKIFDQVICESPSVSMKTDCIGIFLSAWSHRCGCQPQGFSFPIISSENAFIGLKSAFKRVVVSCAGIVFDFLRTYTHTSAGATTGELILLNGAVSVLHSVYLQTRGDALGFGAEFLIIAPAQLARLIVILDEKSNSDLQPSSVEASQSGIVSSICGHPIMSEYNSTFAVVLGSEIISGRNVLEKEKYVSPPLSSTNKKSNTRERNKSLRRASSTVVSMLQSVIMAELTTPLNNRSIGTSNGVADLGFWVATYLQIARLASVRTASSNYQEELSVPLSGSNSTNNLSISALEASAHLVSGPGGFLSSAVSLVTGTNNSNVGSRLIGGRPVPPASDPSPVLSLPNSTATNNKRRCQDLITKPMEFSRHQEGIVIQGDKLINSYKGVDFTIATWVYVTKRQSSRQNISFLTGKVSHNDAWPIVILRPDSKLEVLYGHGNDLDRFCSQAIVPNTSWTHVAVVIEQKKIKLFINGAPDSHVVTSKGNARAILYPVLIGSCPQSVRTRVELVREGFDGSLAAYKYYTRALSPIHVKVVFDQGPPDSSDVREKWIYRLLSAQTPSRLTLTPQLAHKLVDTLMLIMLTESNSNRLRIASVACLQRVLTTLAEANLELKDITLTNNSGFATARYPSSVSLRVATFVSPSSSIYERTVSYFIRVIGACASPHLNIAAEIDDSSPSLLATFDLKSPFPSSDVDLDYPAFKELMTFSPVVITNKTSSIGRGEKQSIEESNASAFGGLVNAVSSSPGILAGRQEYVAELQSHLLRLLRSLSLLENSPWPEAVACVLRTILQRSRAIVANQASWSSTARLEILGSTVFFGGNPLKGPFLGDSVTNKYSENICKIISVNKHTNSYTVLTNVSNRDSYPRYRHVIYILRGADLQTVPETNSNRYLFLTESLMTDILLFMKSIIGHVRLTLHDGLYHPTQVISSDDNNGSLGSSLLSTNADLHPYLRHIILRYVRPLETFYYHQMLFFIADLLSQSSEFGRSITLNCLKQHAEVYEFMTVSATSTVRLNSHVSTKMLAPMASPEKKNGTTSATATPRQPGTKSGYDKLLSHGFEFTSKLPIISDNCGLLLSLSDHFAGSQRFMAAVPDKYMSLDLSSDIDADKLQTDYLVKCLGINAQTVAASPADKYLKRGQIIDASLSLDSQNTVPWQCLVSNWVPAGSVGNKSSSPIGRSAPNISGASISNQKMSFSDLDDSDRLHSLRLIGATRNNIVSLSRAIIQTLPFALQFQTKEIMNVPRQLALWQCLNITEQKEIFSTPKEIIKYLTSSTGNIHAVMSRFERQVEFFAYQLLEASQYKLPTNILQTSDLFERTMKSIYSWLVAVEATDEEGFVLYEMLRILLKAVYFVEGCDVHLVMLRLCRYILRRIHFLTVSNGNARLLVPGESKALNSQTFTLLRSRATELLSRERGHIHVNGKVIEENSVTFAYQLAQIIAGVEVIQRGGLFRPLFNHKQSGALSPSASVVFLFLQHHLQGSPHGSQNKASISPIKIATLPPVVSDIRSGTVSIDVSDSVGDLVEKISAFSSVYLASQPDETKSRQDIVDLVSALSEYIVIEVAIATAPVPSATGSDIVADPVYETIYCGSCMTLAQSGLSPNCSYLVRTRAIIGGANCQWSSSTTFRTDSGIMFTFDVLQSGPDINVSHDGLTATYAGDDNWATILCSRGFSSGVVTWEMRVNHSMTAYIFIGIASSAAELSTFLGGDGNGYGYIGEQALYHNRDKIKIYGETYGAGDVIRVSLDFSAGTLSFWKNGQPFGIAFDRLFGEYYPAVAFYNTGQEIEILPDKVFVAAPQSTLPSVSPALNMHDISLLTELVVTVQTRQSFSHRLLQLISTSLEDWCSNFTGRYKSFTGKHVYLSLTSSLLQKLGFQINDRVRTPYGVAEVAGTAFNRIWFRFPSRGPNNFVSGSNNGSSSPGTVWYFTEHQIIAGREKGHFLRSTYSAILAARSPKAIYLHSTDALPSQGSASSIGSLSFDPSSLGDLIDSSRWSKEMDTILVTFLQNKAEKLSVSPWNIPADLLTDDYRVLQQSLSKVVMSNIDLSHRWGISGPKRRAVIARLGVLRILNHFLEHYLAVLLHDDLAMEKHDNTKYQHQQSLQSEALFGMKQQKTIGDDAYPIIVSTLDPSLSESESNGMYVSRETDISILVSSSLQPISVSQTLALGSLSCIRHHIFTGLKMVHFWDIVNRSTGRPSKTDDDYDYPEELPQIKINRLRSYRAREASELLKIPGEDLYLSSMFCQLWHELRKYPQENLRISYTHPMDDGQARSFKVKFDGEGVDDYGGPYREILQQLCDELQFSDPALSQGKKHAFHRLSTSQATTEQLRLSCFVPLLFPTPNWDNNNDEVTEKYKYTFHPASTSAVRLDLYRFLGQVVGIAIRSRITLDIAFPSIVWKAAVREVLTEEDIASVDYTSYSFVKQMRTLLTRRSSSQASEATQQIDVEIQTLLEDVTWTCPRSDGKVIELLPNGRHIAVSVADLETFLPLYIEAKLTESQAAMTAFRSGLLSIVPNNALTLLTGGELEKIVCGSRVVDIGRLKENTEYDDDISADDPHVSYFWDVLTNDFSEEEKSAFLRFVWARPTLPPKDVDFPQKFKVQSAVGDDAHMKADQYLPKAHTCFFSLNLPRYSSKEVVAEKLRYAILNCTEMDADFRLTDTDVVGWASGVPSLSGLAGAQGEDH